MPQAITKPPTQRKRNRKRKRRAASSSGSSSSSPSSSESSDDSHATPATKSLPQHLPKTTAILEDADSASESSSDSSSSSSSEEIESTTMARNPDEKKPLQKHAMVMRISPSPSPPPADLPSFLPSKKDTSESSTGAEAEERKLKERFRQFWLSSIADGFRDDLEEVRKEPNLGPSRLAMLIDSLASSADVFSKTTATDGDANINEMDVVLS